MRMAGGVGIGIGTARKWWASLAALPGCQIVLVGGVGIADTTNLAPVPSWEDQSGAARDASQPDAAKQPLFLASGINGEPGLRFDGTNDFMVTTNWTMNQSVTMAAVAVAAEQNARIIVDGKATIDNRMSLYGFNPTDAAMFAGVEGVRGTCSFATAKTVVGVFDGASSVLRVNGAVLDSGDAGAQTTTGLTIGSVYTTAANFWSGDIYCVVAFAPALSVGNLAKLEAILRDRYATW